MSTVIVALLHQPQHETALKAYQQRRDEVNSKYTQIQQTKRPTERQSQNWVSVAEIQELIDELSSEAMCAGCGVTPVIRPYDRCHYHVPPGHTRVTVESGHTSNGYWKRAY
eukprot:COSAG02_NODE_5083_length_4652_cov_856.776411_2_plen_111_part_00